MPLMYLSCGSLVLWDVIVKCLEILIALNRAFLFGLASWCVAFGPRKFDGSEETPSTCRIASLLTAGKGESLGNGAETKRPLGA